MAHTYDELRHSTVAQLREIAAGMEHDVLHGYKTMHKPELVKALVTALGIEDHVHHDVVGIDKAKVKRQIRALKEKRDAALASQDSAELKRVRHNLSRLKRKIRRATV